MALEPITRQEQLLNAVASGETANIEPITREEMFLAKLGGADVNTPTPITRKEQFLMKAVEAMGSGSGGDTGGGNVVVSENGIATGFIIPVEDVTTDIDITHNLGEIPKLAVVYRELTAEGFANEDFVSGEVAFSMAVNGEKKGIGYCVDSSTSLSVAVAMHAMKISFRGSSAGSLNGSCIHSCTETTAKLYPIKNAQNKKFAAGHKYRWILFTEDAYNAL